MASPSFYLMQTAKENDTQTCTRCQGTGKVQMNDKEVTCVYCRGTGKATSDYLTKKAS